MGKNDFRKESLIKHYQVSLKTMINDLDFKRFLGAENDYKIMKYSELANYQNINDLLSDKNDYRIILTETKPNIGHWCALLKYDNILEWFDPYGGKEGTPDGQLNFISLAMRSMLGQLRPLLSNLLKTKRPTQNVVYNKEQLQSNNEMVATCGRWCIARILMSKIGYDLPEFIDFVLRHAKELDKPTDILICDWIV